MARPIKKIIQPINTSMDNLAKSLFKNDTKIPSVLKKYLTTQNNNNSKSK